MVLLRDIVLVGSVLGSSNAFYAPAVPIGGGVKPHSSNSLHMSRFPPGGDSPQFRPDEDDKAYLNQKFKNLMTERAMTSLVYCFMEFHDDLTPKWLTEFTTSTGEISEVGWVDYMGMLMTTEPEELIVRRIAQRPRGGSGTNPYLSDTRTQFEYTVLIDPLSIARRVLTLRECISDEWTSELPMMKLENAEISRHHLDVKTMDAKKAETSRKMVADFDDPFTSQGSPLRAKNHQLLVDLITRTSIHRYKSELRYFGDQYTASWIDHFVQDNEDLKGNSLLEQMMEGVMLMIQERRRANSTWNVDGATPAPRFLEPSKVAEAIMHHREAVAAELAGYLEATRRDHKMLHMRHLEYTFQRNVPEEVEHATATDRKKRVIDAVAPKENKAGNLREDGPALGEEFAA